MTWANWASISRRILELLLAALIATLMSLVVVARVVPLAGWSTFVVQGRSMEPAVPLGALVVDWPVEPGQLRVGDVVTIRVGPLRAIFTHRIERIVARERATWIETKGDANRTADPALVPATAVIGRTAVIVPLLGYLLVLLSGPAGLALIGGIFGLLILARLLVATFDGNREPAVNREAGAQTGATLAPDREPARPSPVP